MYGLAFRSSRSVLTCPLRLCTGAYFYPPEDDEELLAAYVRDLAGGNLDKNPFLWWLAVRSCTFALRNWVRNEVVLLKKFSAGTPRELVAL